MTRKEMNIQQKMKQFAQEERSKGKHVRVAFGRVYVDGRVWRWAEKEEGIREFDLNEGNRRNGAENNAYIYIYCKIYHARKSSPTGKSSKFVVLFIQNSLTQTLHFNLISKREDCLREF